MYQITQEEIRTLLIIFKKTKTYQEYATMGLRKDEEFINLLNVIIRDSRKKHFKDIKTNTNSNRNRNRNRNKNTDAEKNNTLDWSTIKREIQKLTHPDIYINNSAAEKKKIAEIFIRIQPIIENVDGYITAPKVKKEGTTNKKGSRKHKSKQRSSRNLTAAEIRQQRQKEIAQRKKRRKDIVITHLKSIYGDAINYEGLIKSQELLDRMYYAIYITRYSKLFSNYNDQNAFDMENVNIQLNLYPHELKLLKVLQLRNAIRINNFINSANDPNVDKERLFRVNDEYRNEYTQNTKPSKEYIKNETIVNNNHSQNKPLPNIFDIEHEENNHIKIGLNPYVLLSDIYHFDERFDSIFTTIKTTEKNPEKENLNIIKQEIDKVIRRHNFSKEEENLIKTRAQYMYQRINWLVNIANYTDPLYRYSLRDFYGWDIEDSENIAIWGRQNLDKVNSYPDTILENIFERKLTDYQDIFRTNLTEGKVIKVKRSERRFNR